MSRAVRIPVTVKMRAGWNDDDRNAPDLARRMEDAGAAAVAVHGRTAAQSYSGVSDWDLIAKVASGVRHSGDRQRRLHRAGAARRSPGRGQRRGRAGRPRRAEESVDFPAGDGSQVRPHATGSDGRRSGAASCSNTSTCCSVMASAKRGIQARRAGSGARSGVAAGTRPREVGHQQAARVELLVHEGPRERIASADGDQLCGLDRRSQGHDRALLPRLSNPLGPLRLTPVEARSTGSRPRPPRSRSRRRAPRLTTS